MKRTTTFWFLLAFGTFSILCTKCEKDSGLPVDGDGNEYDTVVIGTQVWLRENLKTTKYNNGVSIPLITDNSQWSSMTSAAFCWYGNSQDVKENYGALYNWWATKVSFLCPLGYHIPSDEEWQTLIDYLGGDEIAGDKLKSIGTQFWFPPNHGTNESGFSAMPGGLRSHDFGSYLSVRYFGYWWSSSPGINENYGSRLLINYSDNNATLTSWFKKSGLSIRCIKN